MSQERAENLLSLLQGLPNAQILRKESLRLKELLKDPRTISGQEELIATATRECLINLRNGTDIYPVYARLDILEGLAAADHPAFQLVIAETLKDSAELVAKRGESILRRPAIKIYPPTIEFLLNREKEYQEFAFALIENNQSVGITDSEDQMLPTLNHALLTMPDSFRSAVIASRLIERATLSDSLRDQSIGNLRFYLQERVGKLEADFTAVIREVISLNLASARTVQSIPDMKLVLPPDQVSTAMEALDRLGASDGVQEEIEKYQLLVALAEFRTREALAETIQSEQAAAKKSAEERQLKERVVADARERERILKEQAEADQIQDARREEAELVSRARQLFPYL